MVTTPADIAWMPAAVPSRGAAPDETRMDAVELLVHDLDVMTTFYEQAVTLEVIDQSGATATLGRGGLPIMRLRQEKELPGRDRRGAGLYHTAIVFENEARLASALASMAQRASHPYEGSADHLVSEAFYFHDPEGNGLELYRDRPREQWTFAPDGSPQMGSELLDPNAYLRTWYDADRPIEGASAAIGHVHLQVGDIPTARAFYEGVVGFDVTFDMGSALFLSAGGYHHHIGANTWQSGGAGPRAASLGLGDVRISVPTAGRCASTTRGARASWSRRVRARERDEMTLDVRQIAQIPKTRVGLVVTLSMRLVSSWVTATFATSCASRRALTTSG